MRQHENCDHDHFQSGSRCGLSPFSSVSGFMWQQRSGHKAGGRGLLHLHDAPIGKIAGPERQMPDLLDEFGARDEKSRTCGTNARNANGVNGHERDGKTN